jgi:hypothetical protein
MNPVLEIRGGGEHCHIEDNPSPAFVYDMIEN